MASFKLITLQVSDIVRWFKNKELVINDAFQRRAVWTSAAKSFLIDTVLREVPIPVLYLRSIVDSQTQTVVREVVDGQQRVRALIEFANDSLRLSKRSKEYEGKRYSDLDEDSKDRFLSYTLGAEQLINASDDDVLDVFSRLNSYTVTLNAAEKRHAEFQTDFKFAVRNASGDWRGFWETYGVFTLKQRFRMADDAFMAELYGVLIDGVTDGGARQLTKLYKSQTDSVFTDRVNVALRAKIDGALRFFDSCLSPALRGEFSKPYHLLMLFAAYSHHVYGIPAGLIQDMPKRAKLAKAEVIIDRLAELDEALQSSKPPERYLAFTKASSASTHTIATRRIRFMQLAPILSAQMV